MSTCKVSVGTRMVVALLFILLFLNAFSVYAQNTTGGAIQSVNQSNPSNPAPWSGGAIQSVNQSNPSNPAPWSGGAIQSVNQSNPSNQQAPSGNQSGNQTQGGGSIVSGGGNITIGGGSGSNQGGGFTIMNPLKAQTITEFLLAVIDVLLVFAIPLIILFIMYAGYLFVIAQGNPSKITEARSALLWAVVGGVIVLGAELILTVIEGTIASF